MPGRRPYEYLTDPVSQRKIKKPFSMFSGPIPFGAQSRPGQRETRLLVLPNPEGQSRIRVLTTQSYEEAMTEALLELGPEHFDMLADAFRRWWRGQR